MGTLCRERAKPALPFVGRFRVIDFCLSNCVHSGLQDVAVLLDYQRSNLASYLTGGVWLRPIGSLNLRVLAPKSGSHRGTADAAYQHTHHIEQCGAVVINSVIKASTFVGRHSMVHHCILDEEVSIGKFCYIGLGTSPVPGDWDITVVGKNTTVPSYTAIGRGCKVLPNTGLTSFPKRAIVSGAIVSNEPTTNR